MVGGPQMKFCLRPHKGLGWPCMSSTAVSYPELYVFTLCEGVLKSRWVLFTSQGNWSVRLADRLGWSDVVPDNCGEGAEQEGKTQFINILANKADNLKCGVCIALVSQRPDLDYIKFSWNMMTASEFEESWKVKKITKKVDFIHMIQVLYYMEDLESTITFYQSLLKNNGKILFILVSSESGWARLGKTYKDQLPNSGTSWWVTTEDVKRFLDSREVTYQSYELLSQMDITECFSEGSEKGELLLDFLTGVLDFSKTASSELRSSVLAFLRHPDCSTESDGRIIFNNNLGVLIADPLPLSKC
ncbi:histamine N-methyltransferase-like isoform X1 [Thalassophryne amazonica]|uniref:histamine N-methyltransferase-like isoform X1 n=1 Tax=Thalassophryne amazonica TaxID=390379 RepID=UPI001471D969|nr:histamine N-methyltransferase-like isoform X1 [Thalassophryne amazonica]